MNIHQILCVLALTCLLGACGTAPTKTVYVDRVVERVVDRPVSAVITPFPAIKLPPSAPPSSKIRCESLPPMGIQAEKASIKQLLVEIQNARQSYADCANRHNVLVDFDVRLERGLMEVLNHYSSQISRK